MLFGMTTQSKQGVAMPPVTGSVEIARPPEDVFSYVADVRRRGEWQDSVQRVEVEKEETTGIGTRVLETRRVPGGPRAFRWEVTDYDPPTRWGFHGVGNPVNAVGVMTFVPVDDGSKTRVSFEIDFEAKGLAKLIAAFARRGAREEVPRDLAQLKRNLEGSPSAT